MRISCGARIAAWAGLFSIACAVESPPDPEDAGDIDGAPLDGGLHDVGLDAARDAAPPELPDAWSPMDDVGALPDTAAPPDTGCACDDGVPCTIDGCATGSCTHTPDSSACTAGQYCDATAGCAGAGPCATVADCAHPGPCIVATCPSATRTCSYAPLDGDADGYPPIVCGGSDCDDGDTMVHPGAPEACDGIDSDCSGGSDPSTATGCRVDQICTGPACGCSPEQTECVGPLSRPLCVDTHTDRAYCGSCTTQCLLHADCVASACECQTGLTACAAYGACLDLMNDPMHCGSCSHSCGGLACIDGSCGCVAPAVACPSPRATCAVLDRNVSHCGACGHACATDSQCTSSVCSVDPLWFRAYGHTSGGTTVGSSLLAHDVSTHATWVFTLQGGTPAVASRGQLYPTTVPMLWTAPRALVLLAADGSFVREIDMPVSLTGLSAGGARAAIGFSSSATSLTIAGQILTRPVGATFWGATMGLDATGTVVWSRIVASSPRVVVASTGVTTIAFGSTAAIDFGGGVSVPASTIATNVLLWIAPDGTPLHAIRAPGSLDAMSIDAMDRPVVRFSQGAGDITFGGDVFSATATATRYFAVLYDSDGTHERSFQIEGALPLVPLDDALVAIAVRSSGRDAYPQLLRYGYSGSGATLVGMSSMTDFTHIVLTGGVAVGSSMVLFGHGGSVAGTAGPFPVRSGALGDGDPIVVRVNPVTFVTDILGSVHATDSGARPMPLSVGATAGGVIVGAPIGWGAGVGNMSINPTSGIDDGFFVTELALHP